MNQIPISTHLHTKPYQVAISEDRHLPLRKWNHIGTIHEVSHRVAACVARKFVSEITGTHNSLSGIIFEFADGVFVHVGFGI